MKRTLLGVTYLFCLATIITGCGEEVPGNSHNGDSSSGRDVVLANDRMGRLKTFAIKGTLANESVEDSLLDGAIERANETRAAIDNALSVVGRRRSGLRLAICSSEFPMPLSERS